MARLIPSTNAQAHVAAESFSLASPITNVAPHGDGFIHETYLVTTENEERFILQRLNENVFSHPKKVVENTDRILRYLEAKTESTASTLRRVPTLERTQADESFYDDGQRCWRLFRYIENTYSVQSQPTAAQGQQIGEAFGDFLNRLKDFPSQRLNAVLPGYRDTTRYLELFQSACRQDSFRRSRRASEAIAFIEEHNDALLWLQTAIRNGEIPKRIIHGDTKLNNVLLDKATHKWVCVIDLDTVMEGALLQDLGDCIREALSGWSQTSATLIERDLLLIRAIINGFQAPRRLSLTPLEVDSIPSAILSMTLEIGMRFLTDYMEGDRYFRVESPDANLQRARQQFQLAHRLARSGSAIVEVIRNAPTEGTPSIN